ncbi:leukotriene A-4 hydrol [Ascobolus immersus RN42]|uniref:Leukotriene A(4) hydrolase n=1 Tax=Ascobolus immersus RN42 TaxID=1160509 RepID=A0A3N4IPF6_ASCIM|nr:leukotriene A-4 hydrol [Ascobolus immersus RN42]
MLKSSSLKHLPNFQIGRSTSLSPSLFRSPTSKPFAASRRFHLTPLQSRLVPSKRQHNCLFQRNSLRHTTSLLPSRSLTNPSLTFMRAYTNPNLTIMAAYDPNSLANIAVFRTTHVTLDVALDFKKSAVHGTATLRLLSLSDNDGVTKEVILDSSYVDVQGIEANGETVNGWKLEDRKEPYGSALRIPLKEAVKNGKEVDIKIQFSTTDKCTALQWMEPSQTANKKHPYMFSQCQAIHCRSIFPCQDTPSVKAPITFNIRSPLPVVATGLPAGVSDYDEKTGTIVYHFKQDIPLPSYLIAVAAGDLASASIGPRSMVYTGPEELLKCKTELEEDTEPFMKAAESIVFQYPWTTYNVLILPPSFPYGGMENPNMTFATPTIISGDKSNIDVIAHELAHSWSGNLVTNANWQDFWLNEGWTTYLERRIGAAIHGEPHFDFSAIIGWKALTESVKLYADNPEFTKLVVNLEGKDPDDAFSSIPYEKGFTFIYFLDKLVGREKWNKFIPYYFNKYKTKSLTSQDFKDTVIEFFKDDEAASKAISEKVDWDAWYNNPGLPPKPEFDTSLADVCFKLADSWNELNQVAGGPWKPSADDIKGWSSGQIVVFLERISEWETPLKKELVEKLNVTYSLDKTENAEILSRFLNIGLRARDEKVYEPTAYWLGQWGRMKFVRPLYRLLNECDRELAVKTFQKNIDFYHPICRDIVKKDLKL